MATGPNPQLAIHGGHWDSPVFRQFERAWESLKKRTPERATLKFIENWFKLLYEQGAIENWSATANSIGFDLAIEEDGIFRYFYVDGV